MLKIMLYFKVFNVIFLFKSDVDVLSGIVFHHHRERVKFVWKILLLQTCSSDKSSRFFSLISEYFLKKNNRVKVSLVRRFCSDH